jgi:hypothetical protein
VQAKTKPPTYHITTSRIAPFSSLGIPMIALSITYQKCKRGGVCQADEKENGMMCLACFLQRNLGSGATKISKDVNNISKNGVCLKYGDAGCKGWPCQDPRYHSSTVFGIWISIRGNLCF